MPKKRDDIRAIARALPRVLDRPVAYHRAFADLRFRDPKGKSRRLGAVGALVLSQMLYWTARTNDPQGWFWKTYDEWDEELGLTRRELDTARARLKALGVLHEARRGMPARLYYRLDLEVLAELLFSEPVQTNKPTQNPDPDPAPGPNQPQQPEGGKHVRANRAIKSARNARTTSRETREHLKEYRDYQRLRQRDGEADASPRSEADALERVKALGTWGLLQPREDAQNDPRLARVQDALAEAARRAQDPVLRLRDWFTDETWPLAQAFMRLVGILPKSRKEARGWWEPLQDMARGGATPALVEQVVSQMLRDGLTLKSPYSIRHAVRSRLAAQQVQTRRARAQSGAQPVSSLRDLLSDLPPAQEVL